MLVLSFYVKWLLICDSLNLCVFLLLNRENARYSASETIFFHLQNFYILHSKLCAFKEDRSCFKVIFLLNFKLLYFLRYSLLRFKCFLGLSPISCIIYLFYDDTCYVKRFFQNVWRKVTADRFDVSCQTPAKREDLNLYYSQ